MYNIFDIIFKVNIKEYEVNFKKNRRKKKKKEKRELVFHRKW